MAQRHLAIVTFPPFHDHLRICNISAKKQRMKATTEEIG